MTADDQFPYPPPENRVPDYRAPDRRPDPRVDYYQTHQSYQTHQPVDPTPPPGPAPASTTMRDTAVAVTATVAVILLGFTVFNGFSNDGEGEQTTVNTDVGDDAGTATDDGDDGQTGASTDATTEAAPLSPSRLPSADESGMVALNLDLIDVYTGTGSAGSVELYLNTLTGKVCHTFDTVTFGGRYRAFIHEAEFPREGPVIVDLGEVANTVPRCVTASPIDVARALSNPDGFYIAAHDDDVELVVRGQLASAETVIDNRDPATLVATDGSDTGDAGEDLFGSPDNGAYLIVDANKVTFTGPVPDEQTAQRLRAAFVPLSGLGVDVVDDLQIQAGAPAPSGRVIVADALLFASNQSRIDGDPPVLATLANLLVVNPTWTITVTGHTDDVGDFLYNIDLSLRRANSIRDRLATLGVPAERVRVQGAGPEEPIAENTTPEGRAANRRIEIQIDS